MIPDQVISSVLARTDIVSLIDGRVPLKKAGREYKACCPFHDEKTASFSVSESKQLFYCFGCGAAGDAIEFLVMYDRLLFTEAVEVLAKDAGIEIHKSRPENYEALESLYSVMADAARFYQSQLSGAPRQYLSASRGLSNEIIGKFQLGHAPEGWNTLPSHPGKETMAIAAGLKISGEKGTYDRFRNRITFPIRDVRGRVIALGGRVLDDSKPKYLNSPETQIYSKSSELYGLYETRLQGIPDRLIVVEGYLDVISLHQAGVCKAVATLGTAFTEQHARLAFRYTDEIIFCFDGDEAGRKAANAALLTILSVVSGKKTARFLFLPEGYDPDSYVRQHGGEALEAAAASLPGLMQHTIEVCVAGLDMETADGRRSLVEAVKPFISATKDDSIREILASEIARLTGASRDSVAAVKAPKSRTRTTTPSAAITPARRLIQLMLEYPLEAETVNLSFLETIDTEAAKMAYKVWYYFDIQLDQSMAGLLAAWAGTQDAEVIKKIASLPFVEPEGDPKEEMLEIAQELGRDAGKSRLEALKQASRERTLTTEEQSEVLKLISGG